MDVEGQEPSLLMTRQSKDHAFWSKEVEMDSAGADSDAGRPTGVPNQSQGRGAGSFRPRLPDHRPQGNVVLWLTGWCAGRAKGCGLAHVSTEDLGRGMKVKEIEAD